MNRNALVVVAVVLFSLGAVTVYFLRPIDESTRIEVEDVAPVPPVKKEPVVAPPVEAQPIVVPPIAPIVAPKTPDVDLSAEGVRKYTPLPKPAFFATDGLPQDTEPINPLDIRAVPAELTAAVKEQIATIEKNPKDAPALQRMILFLCRSGRFNEATPYFDRYLAANGTMKDLGEIVVSDPTAPGEAIGGGLEFYIRGLAMVGRFKDANARQKELDEQLPGYAESGMSLVFLRFYELFDFATRKKNPTEAMYSLERFNSVWPTGSYTELESQAASAFIRILTEAKADELVTLLPKLGQVWPHLPSNTMKLLTDDLLKKGAPVSPVMLNAADPTLGNDTCNPAALIRRSLQTRAVTYDLDTATQQAQRALTLAQTLQLPELEIAAQWNLADVAHASNNLSLELMSVGSAEKLAADSKKEGLHLYTSLRTAALQEHLADERKAIDTYLAVFKRAKEKSASVTALRALMGYSRLISRYIKPADVEATLKSQAEGFEKAKATPRLQAEPFFNLGVCYQRQGKVNEAAAAYSKVLQGENLELGLRAYIQIGQLCMHDKNATEAEKAFGNAREMEKQVRNPELRWRAGYGLARARNLQKDTAGARTQLAQTLNEIEAQQPSVATFQSRRALDDYSQEVWQLAIDLALKDGDGEGAFLLAERCRARAIQEVFGSVKLAPKAATLADVKAASGAQKTVLYLALPESLLIWVVSGTEVSFERIQVPQRQLYGEVVGMLKSSSVMLSTGSDWRASMTKGYDRLWKPIAKYFKDGDRICIVPHGLIQYVPFSALYDGNAFLVEKNDLHVAPSGAALVELRKREPGMLTPGTLFDSLQSADAQSNFGQTEIAGIQQLYPLSKVLKGREATGLNLANIDQNTGLLHLSAPARFDSLLPIHSGFEAFKEGKNTIFTLEDIAKLRIPNAALAAYNTTPSGVQERWGGDDAAAIARVFQIAGARNVLTPLWNLDNTLRMNLMKAFYTNLKTTSDPTAALCAAQRSILKTSSAPYGWAGFVISGAGK